MRLMSLAAAGAVALASAGVATGQNGDSAGQKAANKDGDRVICRRVRDTSSLAGGRRECRTRADWDRIARDARANNPMASAMSGGTSSN